MTQHILQLSVTWPWDLNGSGKSEAFPAIQHVPQKNFRFRQNCAVYLCIFRILLYLTKL